MRLLLGFFFSALLFSSAYALPFLPVGGKIIFVYECACSGGYAILVGPPRGGIFLVQTGISRVYRWWALVPGANVVGRAIPGGVCSAGTAACFPIPVQGTILQIGSSLPSPK